MAQPSIGALGPLLKHFFSGMAMVISGARTFGRWGESVIAIWCGRSRLECAKPGFDSVERCLRGFPAREGTSIGKRGLVFQVGDA